MRIVSDSSLAPASSAGLNVDVTDPRTACLAGAAVIGATVVVGSVGITTIAAPAVTLVPAAIAGGLVVAAHQLTADDDTASAPADAPAAA